MPAVEYFQRRQRRSCLYSSSRSLRPAEWSCCCWSLGCAVCNGCNISQQLLLTTPHCCRWGLWLICHTVSPHPVNSYSLHTLCQHTQTHILPPPPAHTPAPAAGTPRHSPANSGRPVTPDHCWLTRSHTQLYYSGQRVRYVIRGEQETSGISDLTHHVCGSVLSHRGEAPLWNEKWQNTSQQWGKTHK